MDGRRKIIANCSTQAGASAMKQRFPLTISCILCLVSSVSMACAQNPAAPPVAPPTWQSEIAQGREPFHQLTVDDFHVKEAAKGAPVFYVKTFIDPRYHFYMKPYNGFVHAYTSEWVIFSGFDKSQSYRLRSFHKMKDALPYAQAILDLAELHARELGAIKVGDLPEGRAGTYEEARAQLENKLKVMCEEKYKQTQTEIDAFDEATQGGENKKKLRD